jgi:hypothetical protein
MTAVGGDRLPFWRIPYVLDGDDPAELAMRSAQIDLEESHTLDRDRDAERIRCLEGSAERWRRQATEIREAAHQQLHERAEWPMPSLHCVRCNPTGAGLIETEIPDL